MTSIIDPVKAIKSHKPGIMVGNILVTIINWSDILRGISNTSENQNAGKKILGTFFKILKHKYKLLKNNY